MVRNIVIILVSLFAIALLVPAVGFAGAVCVVAGGAAVFVLRSRLQKVAERRHQARMAQAGEAGAFQH